MLRGVKKVSYMFLMSLLVMIAVLPSEPASAKENRFFVVQEITGVAYIQKAGGMKSIRAAIGMKLHQGDRIQTEELSSILLQAGDTKDNVTIGENSDISLVHLHENEGFKMTSLKAWKGSVYADVTPVKNKKDRFQIMSIDATFHAKGTHFVVAINPLTGLPTMFVGAGTVEVDQESNPNNGAVPIFPTQQISPGLTPNLPDGVHVVDLDSFLPSVDSTIIEQILINKAQIDEENRAFINSMNKVEMNLDSEVDFQRYQQNVDNLLASLLKSAITSGQVSPEEAKRLIELYNNNKSPGSLDFDRAPALQISEEEKKKQQAIEQLEEKRKQQQEELARKQRELENQNQALIQRLEEERKRKEEANRLAAEKAKKEAEEKLLASLAEQQRKKMEDQLRQREQEKKEQEERRNSQIPTPPTPPPAPTPQPPSDGGGENGNIPVNPDAEAANRIIVRINSIPTPLTLASRDLVDHAREGYNALTDPQRKLVTNLQKLVDFEVEIERLLMNQEITLQIVSEIEKNINQIKEIDNVTEASYLMDETRLMINSLYGDRALISGELLTYFEETEVNLVEELIANLVGFNDEYQLGEVQNKWDQLTPAQKNSVTNKDVLFEMEVQHLTRMVLELAEMDSISIDYLEQIDYMQHLFDRLEESHKGNMEEQVKEKIEQLAAEKVNVLSQEGNLDEYISRLSFGQNQRNIHFLLSIYQQENLTEAQQENILSALDMYIRERSIYHFHTESLDYSKNYQVVFLSDGNHAVYIPLNTHFQNINELKDYVKSYTEGRILVNINMDEENYLYAKASLPNVYLSKKALELSVEF
ncbi:FecR domain-containing protein [uncultured Psychrobacillus sp.]|mgnify:CR=1 FL=1|uniref:FecR domain-containing protein n=1 Tax=uncultured Psychrobacillus sp. TaxID=1551585 RepID=UPI0026373429|nr:FecR domain-containing protein [uncultured Psychrobacillus sp.]